MKEKAAANGPAVIKMTKRKLVAAGTAETVEIEREVEAKLDKQDEKLDAKAKEEKG